MRFKLPENTRFLDAGVYQIVREFDDRRWIIRVNPETDFYRVITIVKKELGEVI